MIHFAKMQGLGNDFVVINAIDHPVKPSELPIKTLADRHLGIGFDQLLILETTRNADFYCRIFNSDGSEAAQCGNGLRCIARFIHDKKLHPSKRYTIETKGGIFTAILLDAKQVQISMGKPTFATPSSEDADLLAVLSLGNPHAIIKVASIDQAPVQDIGKSVNQRMSFPHGVNVGFMEVVNREHIRLRTYERGAGETKACGSNACAAVVAAIKNNLVDRKVKVELSLGDLWIEWDSVDAAVVMTGPAEWVFEGSFPLGGSIK